jgi:hypothetical protein
MKLQQLLSDIQGENRQAALLVAQVGAMPTELQLIVQIADYDDTVKGLRPLRSYIIRVGGVIEHQISNLGVTVGEITLEYAHPLLYQYTEPAAAVFFRGIPADTNAIVLDIAQAHASTFQGWRQFPQYLNVEKPLETLFRAGGGLLGQMPQSLADALVKVLEHHGVEHKVLLSDPVKPEGAMQGQKIGVLRLGESYFISYLFSVDELGKT